MTVIADAFRVCSCAAADVEPVPEVPNVLRCIECHGWVVLHVDCYEDCLRVERHLRPPVPEDDE